jgi:oligoribonuclease NrnB/cAMP/cGMP phosphodiesterase (DHH superfamily)
MTKVFYHNDADGWVSAYWVKKHLDNTDILYTPTDFIEMNYDKKFNFDIIKNSEVVYMVDFSLNPEDMLKLAQKAHLIWIDHHKTAIDKMKDYINLDEDFKDGIRIDGVAACALTWAYVTGSEGTESLIEDAPLFTQYVHLWDTWQWKNHPEASKIEAFITAFNSYVNGPCDPVFDNFITDDTTVSRVVQVGYNMIMFRDVYGQQLCESIGNLIKFEGYECFACNMPRSNSEWFKSIDPSTYDILMPFYYNMKTKQFCVSLYTSNPKIDVGKIAVKYNGGGHFSSAGFQCRNLPF